jgi:hypothetical protein
MKGTLTVVESRGEVKIAVIGLDVAGMPEETPSLLKMSPDEARELAKTLVDAARRAEGE